MKEEQLEKQRRCLAGFRFVNEYYSKGRLVEEMEAIYFNLVRKKQIGESGRVNLKNMNVQPHL